MTVEMILNALNSIHNGSFVRIKYKSDLPLKAASKKSGIVVTKICNTTARFGIDYYNISSVIKRDAERTEPKVQRTNNQEWIVEDKISYNRNTDKHYLHVFTVKNHSNSDSKYTVKFEDGHIEEMDHLSDAVKEFIIPSYFKSSKPDYVPTEIKKINTDNILEIGGIS